MDNKKAKVIAFYLPQFHPIPENDKWWGKGFTEWTSVGKAKKYFIGHEQPNVPADLGYYDLRLPQVREAQAELAKEAGIDAFCYWHYWLGNGKQLLELPLQEVIRLKEPDFPFCLGWANHSWINKSWNSSKQTIIPKILIEQLYPGKKDIDDHFYKMLPVFKDERYFKIHGKLLFAIFNPLDIPDFEYFRNRWNELAGINNLPEFFFIANTGEKDDISIVNNAVYKKYDAIMLYRLWTPWRIDQSSFFRFLKFITRNISRIIGYSLNVVEYAKAIQMIDTPLFKEKRIYPVIIPNFDNSPRRGPGAYIYKNSTPLLFKKHVKQILSYLIDKNDEDKIIFLKSWNEWAEGNYMEPDLKWGKGYIKALREALEEEEL
jgi:hypothetical protein